MPDPNLPLLEDTCRAPLKSHSIPRPRKEGPEGGLSENPRRTLAPPSVGPIRTGIFKRDHPFSSIRDSTFEDSN